MESSYLKSDKSDTKIHTTINIKKEGCEILHPLSYYVDDRIELARQIFTTLKPKTVYNCAPSFLKDLAIDKIEERCLDELLGISKKRLRATIAGARCSSNTDSSDDSIPKFNDYISLEEISSDSNCETPKNETENKSNSALELLELQARARAIRSQLALEPITKIEVNSDGNLSHEKNGAKSSDSEIDNKSIASCESLVRKKLLQTVSKRNKNKSSENVNIPSSSSSKTSHIKSEKDFSTSSKDKFFRSTNYFYGSIKSKPLELDSKDSESIDSFNEITTNEIPNNEVPLKCKPKKIGMKRNFRNNQSKLEEVSYNGVDAKNSLSTNSHQKDQPHNSAESEQILIGELNKFRGRSSSADVVTIMPSPETLSISDTSDEDTYTNKLPNSNFELEKVVKHISDQEDGEIIDGSTDSDSEIKNLGENEKGKQQKTDSASTNDITTKSDVVSLLDEAKSDDLSVVEDIQKLDETLPINVDKEICEILSLNDEKQKNDYNNKSGNDMDDDDPNDDIISLEGADLVNEMKEHLKDNKPTKRRLKSKKHRSKKRTEKRKPVEDAIDIINLNDTSAEEDPVISEEERESQTWKDRWLNSSKVSNMLIMSRIANRVRVQRKETNKKQIVEKEKLEVDEIQSKKQNPIVSNCDEGSVEQYKAITEHSKKC